MRKLKNDSREGVLPAHDGNGDKQGPGKRLEDDELGGTDEAPDVLRPGRNPMIPRDIFT